MQPMVIAPIGGLHRLPAEKVAPQRMEHVEGLRGLAIALVVIFHLFVGRVSSGVDVFLFLGGVFLLSSQLSSAYDKKLSLGQSIIRLGRRLVPTVVVTVSLATIASFFIYPSTMWKEILSDAAAAVMYYTNWHEILKGNSYGVASGEVSIFQHLWSMSVQLHIYLVVIIAVFVLVRLCVKFGMSRKWVTGITVLVISSATVASFAYALVMTEVDQSQNYYSTFSRFYEIGIGALLGMILTGMTLTPVLRWILGTIGLVVIGSIGFLVNGVEAFPGPIVLIPLMAAACIVVAGRTSPHEEVTWKTMGPVKLLYTTPVTFLGSIAYPLYLVHWPLLILSLRLFDAPQPLIAAGVGSVSLPLAWLLHKGVEEPLRQHVKPGYTSSWSLGGKHYRTRVRRRTSPWHIVSAVATIVTMLLLATGPYTLAHVQQYQESRQRDKAQSLGEYDTIYPGSAAFLYGADVPEGVPIMPPVTDLAAMMPPTTEEGCYAIFGDTDLKIYRADGSLCWYGDVSSDKTMYVAGGSHSEQYITALDKIGKKRGFKVLPIVKMGCALNSKEVRWDGTTFEECQEWSSHSAVPYIVNNPPTEGVFMTSTRPATVHGRGPEMVPDSYIEIHQLLSDKGITIYSIRDNPWMMMNPEGDEQKNVRICLSEGNSSIECGQPASESLLSVNPAIAAYADIDNVTLLDITPALCTPGPHSQSYCPAIVGNIIAYRDSHHITSQLIETMSDFLEKEMFGEVL